MRQHGIVLKVCAIDARNVQGKAPKMRRARGAMRP
jgi:hypothetical protein